MLGATDSAGGTGIYVKLIDFPNFYLKCLTTGTRFVLQMFEAKGQLKQSREIESDGKEQGCNITSNRRSINVELNRYAGLF